MPPQTQKAKRQVIEDARKDGTFDDLFWYVTFDLPVGFGGKLEQVSAGATYNGGVPVIKVAPDPDASEPLVELLRWQFEQNNRGRRLTFHYALTRRDILDQTCPGWYEWGEERTAIDNICPNCGQIVTAEYYQEWNCCGFYFVT